MEGELKITKHKDPKGWRLSVDGTPTGLVISKGDAPRFRQPQMYDLTADVPDDQWGKFLFECNSVSGIIERLEIIAAALQSNKEG